MKSSYHITLTSLIKYVTKVVRLQGFPHWPGALDWSEILFAKNKSHSSHIFFIYYVGCIAIENTLSLGTDQLCNLQQPALFQPRFNNT